MKIVTGVKIASINKRSDDTFEVILEFNPSISSSGLYEKYIIKIVIINVNNNKINDPNPKNFISPNLSFFAKNSAAYFFEAFRKPKSA